MQYLIPPAEEPIEFPQGVGHPVGTASVPPEITCIGRFFSLDPIRMRLGDFSGLVVIWFQKEFAFPIDPVALSQILQIDWERHAYDWDF